MGEIASAKDTVKEHNPPVVHESATVAGSTTAKSGAVPETSPTAGAGARAAWMRQLQRSVGNARAGAMAAVAAGGADTQPLAHELTHVVIQQRHDPVESADHGGALKVSDPSDRGEQAADVPTSRRSTVH